MNPKKVIAELYANVNLSANQYRMLPVFSEIEANPDIVEDIERFHLPEITKLICCSDTILSFEWAKKYLPLREYCIGISPINLEDIFSVYEAIENSVVKFEDDFLSTQYTPVVKSLCEQSKAYYEVISSIRLKINEKYDDLDRAIKKQDAVNHNDLEDQGIAMLPETVAEDKKPLTKKTSDTEKEITSLMKDLELLENQLSEKVAFVEKYQKYLILLNRYYDVIISNDEENRRRAAYKSLNTASRISVEEKFVYEYRSSGMVDDEYRERLLDNEFCRKYLKILGQKNSQSYAVPFLVHLHNQAEIDIEDDIYKSFLSDHADLIVPFLMEEYRKNNNLITDDTIKTLVEILLSAVVNSEKEFDSAKLFNQIHDVETWKYIFSSAITFEDKCNSIARLLNGLNGKAAQCMVDLISDAQASEIRISVHDICESLLRLSANNNDIVLRLIGLLEQSQRKLQRKLNTSERIVRSQSQEVFSNLYSPMQDLEGLTASIKDTNEIIDCNLVASKLFTVVEELRVGLSSLGVDAVEDFETWKKRDKISFDPQRHKVFLTNDDNADDISEVKVRTLGFTYHDDEDAENKVLAEVFIDEIYPDNPPKKGSGYPKGIKINSATTPKGRRNNLERNKKNKRK